MSSEEFEKLHEIYKSLYEELKLMPEKAAKCYGGKLVAMCKASIYVIYAFNATKQCAHYSLNIVCVM